MQGPEIIDQLKKLWLLDLIVEHGSFQRAAILAKVTRSAVSQTISHLEKHHQKKLLVREGGGVEPTPYCVALLDRARPILASLDSLELPREDTPKMSWLDLGAFESLAVSIMPQLLKRLKAECPGIRIKIRIAKSGRLATMVRKGELCMAIITENELADGLTNIPLAKDQLGLFVSRKIPKELHSIDAIGKISLGALAPEPEGNPAYFSKFLRALNLSRSISFSCDTYEAILAATCKGSIIGVLPKSVAGRANKDLLEITPAEIRARQIGAHNICLISEKNCDPRENEFLAKEIRTLLEIEATTTVKSI